MTHPIPHPEGLQDTYTHALQESNPENVDLLNTYTQNSHHIFQTRTLAYNVTTRAQRRKKDIKFTFNLPLPPNIEASNEKHKSIILEHFRKIVLKMRFQCKVSMSVGGILQERIDNDTFNYRYFEPRNNFNIITNDSGVDTPYLFRNKETAVDEFASLLSEIDLSRCVSRPDTKCIMKVITNIHFILYETGVALTNDQRIAGEQIPTFPIEVEEFVRKKRCIFAPSFSKDADCIWQCLIQIFPDKKPRELEKMFKTYLNNLGLAERQIASIIYGGLRLFHFLDLDDVPQTLKEGDCKEITVAALIEECFDINLYVYTLSLEDISSIRADLRQGVPSYRVRCTGTPLYTSCKLKKDKPSLELLVHWNEEGFGHSFFIRDVKQFFTQFRCQYCDALFQRRDTCERHQSARACLSPFVYPGGTFQRSKSIWEKCTELGIDYSTILNNDSPKVDYCVTFDIEAGVKDDGEVPVSTSKETVIGQHDLVSIAYKSNVPGMDEAVFHSIWQPETTTPDSVFERFYSDMKKMQNHSEELWHERMKALYAEIEQKIIHHGGMCYPTVERFQTFSASIREDYDYIKDYVCKEKSGSLTEDDMKCYKKRFSRAIVPESSDERCSPLPYSDGNLNEVVEKYPRVFGEIIKDASSLSESAKSHSMKDQKNYVIQLQHLLRRIKRFGALLPVVGYNSGGYDLNVLNSYWTPYCVTKTAQCCRTQYDQRDINVDDDEDDVDEGNVEEKLPEKDDGLGKNRDKMVNAIKNNSRYKSVITRDGIHFLDLYNYLPAGTSLDKAVRDYKVPDKKGVFPYSILSRADLPQMSISSTSESYDLFIDNLKQHIHRPKGNLLENDWVKFTSKKHSWSVLPIVHKIADEMSENDEDYLEWLDLLGLNDIQYQKPRTHDLESFETSFVHLLPERMKKDCPYISNGKTNSDAIGLKKLKTGIECFHNDFIKVCRENDFQNFHDFLKYYNVKDVVIMHPLIRKMNINFQGISPQCQMFRDNTSLPHIARNIGYEFAEKEGGIFHLCKGYDEGDALERKIRRNLAGGPSIIFNRNLKKGSFIPNSPEKICTIQTWDANALYPKCMMYKMPIGQHVHVYEPFINEHHETWLKWRENRIADSENELFEIEEPRNIGESMDDWCYRKLGQGSLNSSLIEKMWIQSCNEELKEIWKLESSVYEVHQCSEKYIPLEKCYIQTQRNNVEEKPIRIGCGFCPDGVRFREQWTDLERKLYPEDVKGILYEFLGDYYHGNPKLIARLKQKLLACADEEIEKKKKLEKDIETLSKRYDDTMAKFTAMNELGFYIRCEWESDFSQKLTKEDREKILDHEYPPFTREYLKHGFHKEKKCEYLRNISDAEKFMELLMKDFDPEKVDLDIEQDIAFFGLAEVDISLPEEVHADHDDFPCLFVRGPIIDNGEKRANLRGLFSAEKTVLITPYLQFLIHMGYKITRVYRAWEYQSKAVLRPFVERVVAERKKGDLQGGNAMLANTYKLVGNSFYGGSLMCKDKHSQIQYSDSFVDLMKAVNRPFFINHTIISENVIEIQEVHKKIKQNVPIQIGKFILDHAKARMCMFYKSIVQKFCHPGKYALISMDTDSFTLVLAGKIIDDIVLPEFRSHWDSNIKKFWFVHEPCTKPCQPDICNLRQPGPMKKEYEGDNAIALSSKLFCITNNVPGINPKIASKGLRKNGLYYNPLDLYRKTLMDTEKMQCQFASIKLVRTPQNERKIHTTLCSRTVSNTYSKRVLSEDGSRTTTVKGVSRCGTPEKDLHLRYIRQTHAKKRKHTENKNKNKRQRRGGERMESIATSNDVPCDLQDGELEDEMEVEEGDLNEFLIG